MKNEKSMISLLQKEFLGFIYNELMSFKSNYGFYFLLIVDRWPPVNDE